MFVDWCRLIELPTVREPRGTLTFAEGERHVPFSVKRVFYLFDVPAEGKRGGHAHKRLEQVLVCVTGRFKVIADDGSATKQFTLSEPSLGLYIPPLIWDTETCLQADSVLLVLASEYYVESDYYRDYDQFLIDVRRARTRKELEVHSRSGDRRVT